MGGYHDFVAPRACIAREILVVRAWFHHPPVAHSPRSSHGPLALAPPPPCVYLARRPPQHDGLVAVAVVREVLCTGKHVIPGTTGHDRRAIGDHLDARRGEPLDVEAFFDTMRVYFRPRGEARGEDRRTCRKEERTPVASPASPASEAIAAVKGPSQEDMCAVWAPRILRDGRRARKTAFAYCRPAVLGESTI